MKKVILLFVLVIIAICTWFYFDNKKNLAETTQDVLPPQITYINATSDLIEVELPFPGAVTGKEFGVIGQARGYWFFEASFPIELLDKDGKTIAVGIAQAEGEWMTENFVPFRADLKVGFDFQGEPIAGVSPDYIGPATLVLHKDNPSGLPENDASISFPITVEY